MPTMRTKIITITQMKVVVGNPGRVVKMRFNASTIARLLEIEWWNWSHERIGETMGLLIGGDIEAFLNTYDSPRREKVFKGHSV
jgi:hypothetical protein